MQKSGVRMPDYKVVETYVQPLFQYALSLNTLDSVLEELKRFQEAVEGHKELEAFFDSKAFSRGEKAAVLKELLEKLELSPLTANFYILLAENQRFDAHAPKMALKAFEAFLWQKEGIHTGVLSMARLPEAAEQEKIRERLEEKLNLKLILDFQEDPALIEGSRLELDGTVYEQSIKDRLSHLDRWIKGI